VARLAALYDSCVLYPAPLRDLLVRLAGEGLVRARWTNTIHEEWIRNVLESRPELSRERLERTRDLMNEHILDSLVADYEHLIPSFELPDPDDRHILAAAITAQVDLIVTFNLRDFPEEILAQHTVAAIHPDDFLLHILDQDEESVCSVLQKQRADLRNPPVTSEQLLATLKQQGLSKTTLRLSASTFPL
jgi:hypothetical protein